MEYELAASTLELLIQEISEKIQNTGRHILDYKSEKLVLERGRITELKIWDEVISLRIGKQNSQLMLTALKLATESANIQLPFIVIKDSYQNSSIEGYSFVDYRKLFCVVQSRVPTSCLQLKGLLRIFDDRIGVKDETRVSVNVEYIKESFSLVYSSFWDMPNWFLRDLSYRLDRKLDPNVSLTLSLAFPKQTTEFYQQLLIDPTLADSWKLQIKPVEYPFHYISSMLKRAIDDIQDYLQSPFAINYNFIPGTFDFMPEAEQRHYVDIRDIENALVAIFSPTADADESDTKVLINTLRFKNVTVPKHSLLWKLGVRLFDACAHSPEYLSFDVGMIPLLKGIWSEFIRYIQYYWDQSIYIPNINIILGDGEVGINREYNLLHQKLCMINCCIYRKTGKPPSESLQKSMSSDGSGSPLQLVTETAHRIKDLMSRKESYVSTSWESNDTDTSWGSITKPNVSTPSDALGRKQILEGYTSQSGEPIWEPHVQPPVYMTEDMLEEFEMILEQFGDDPIGQQNRLKLQSQELVSDMKAFKAANPKADFEDFVKWFVNSNEAFSKGLGRRTVK